MRTTTFQGLSAATLTLLGTFGATTQAQAQQSAKAATAATAATALNIPSQPLRDALTVLGRQTGLQVIYTSTEVTDALTAPPLEGTFTAQAALARLLEHSGLTYEFLNDRTVAIRSKAQATQSSSASFAAPSETLAAAAIRVAQSDSTNSQGPNSEPRQDVPVPSKETKEGEKLDEIVVTGTNIRGCGTVGAKVITLDAEAIQRSGYTSIDEVIQTLPQVFRGGASSATPDGQNFGSGSLAGLNQGYGAGINLRGLGSSATLTLLNGNRMAASSSGTLVDISAIPMAAIERVEVLPDGASAIYGADAVGGVVNIILKDHYDGAETGLTYGASTAGGRDEKRINQTLGTSWSSGHALLTVDYLNQDALYAKDRSFTSSVVDPTTIFPSNKVFSVVFAGTQRLTDRLDVSSSMLLSDAHRLEIYSGQHEEYFPVVVKRADTSLTLRYNAVGDWVVQATGTGGREEDDSTLFEHYPIGGPIDYYANVNEKQNRYSAELRADGTVGNLPSGAVKVSFGLSHSDEKFHEVQPGSPYASRYSVTASRKVDAEFAELNVPLLQSGNVSWLDSAKASLAVRHDNYSDFGATTNPKIGLNISATPDFTLRTSWGKSFRAPSVGYELQTSQSGSLYVLEGSGTTATGDIPVAFLSGSKTLTAETSRNFSAGINFSPARLAPLDLDLTYFHIAYENQVTTPPGYVNTVDASLQTFITTYASPAQLAQVVNNYLANGAVFLDFSNGEFGPDPLSVTTVLYDGRQLNAASTKIDGFDFSAKYGQEAGLNHLNYAIALTYLHKYDVTPVPGAPVLDEVDTLGRPASIRARANVEWSRGPVSALLAINHVGGYKDPTAVVVRDVASYTTLDFNASLHLDRWIHTAMHSGSLGISVTNLFDRDPPYIAAPQTLEHGHYDAANADPLGRYVSVYTKWQW